MTDQPTAGVALKLFPEGAKDVQSRFVIVHQLRASADIQDDQTKRETGWATTSDRASLMREAADTIETLALRTPASGPVEADVRRLVIAARVVAFEDQSPEALKALDKASEAFASVVPWDDEPEGEPFEEVAR